MVFHFFALNLQERKIPPKPIHALSTGGITYTFQVTRCGSPMGGRTPTSHHLSRGEGLSNHPSWEGALILRS
jgi:hypothetical protein